MQPTSDSKSSSGSRATESSTSTTLPTTQRSSVATSTATSSGTQPTASSSSTSVAPTDTTGTSTSTTKIPSSPNPTVYQPPPAMRELTTAPTPTDPSSPTASDYSEEIKNTVREEIERIAFKIIEEEIEKEIEDKIGSKKISASRRSRVHRKVTSESKKQAQELIDKIVKNQLDRNVKPTLVEEKRVSEDIEKGLSEEIKTIVQRSMERAIADEILEQVQIEKLSRTPTVEPELAHTIPGTLGVRHAQTFMILLFLAISYVQRVDFYVAEIAMTEAGSANPNFAQFDWNERILSLLLSSFYWGYFVLQIPGGILAEKYGPKLIMTASMMACSLLGLLMPVVTLIGDWVGLYIMKLLQGVFQGTFIPAVYVFTARWIPPKERARLFTPAFGGMQLGIVIGMPITGVLCASALGWPAAFYFSSCIGFFWVVVWIYVAANSPSVHRSISREEKLYIEGSFGFGEITVRGAEKIIPWKSILTSPPYWALVICQFGQNWAFSTLITEMPAYMNYVLLLNITNNAIFSAMTYFIGWIFIVLFGFIANYIQEKEWMGLSFQRKAWNSIAALGGTISFLVLAISQTRSETLAIILLTITISTNSASYNGVFSNHADLSPNYIGILMGVSNMFANAASVMAPIYVGYVVSEYSNPDQWSIVFATAAIILFLSNMIFIIFGSSDIQPWNTPSDLHLQLEEVEAKSLSHRRPRRGGNVYVVTGQEDEIESPRKHRNSI